MFLPAIVLFYATLVRATVVSRDQGNSINPRLDTHDPYQLGCDFIMRNPLQNTIWPYSYFNSSPSDLNFTLEWCVPLLLLGPLRY